MTDDLNPPGVLDLTVTLHPGADGGGRILSPQLTDAVDCQTDQALVAEFEALLTRKRGELGRWFAS